MLTLSSVPLALAPTGETHQRQLRAGVLERPPDIVEGVQLAAREVKARRCAAALLSDRAG